MARLAPAAQLPVVPASYTLGTTEWRCRVFSSRLSPYMQNVGQSRKLSYRMPTANGRVQPAATTPDVCSAAYPVFHPPPSNSRCQPPSDHRPARLPDRANGRSEDRSGYPRWFGTSLRNSAPGRQLSTRRGSLCRPVVAVRSSTVYVCCAASCNHSAKAVFGYKQSAAPAKIRRWSQE